MTPSITPSVTPKVTQNVTASLSIKCPIKKNQIKQPGQFDIELSSDDSSDTDYELDIDLLLIDIKEGLKGWYDSTPVSH